MNLIIDGNYFFYKTLFIASDIRGKGKALGTKKEQEIFIRKVAIDLTHAIRTFGNPDRIIFTIDSKSWRKDVAIEEGSYKSNRDDKSDEIDWDSFYSCMKEFGEILSAKGMITSNIEKAEGDDLMYFWSNKLYENGMDSIIITGDKDLTQCIKYNGKNFVIVYNPNSTNRKIIAPIGFREWLDKDEIDLFDSSTYMNSNKDYVLSALSSVPLEEHDPKYTIFEKVLTGDSGDTVPSVWTWVKNGRNYRVTGTKASKIYDCMNSVKPIEDVYDLPNRCDEVAKLITEFCKQTVTSKVIKSRLERNLKLVFLDNRVIPNEIQKRFDESFNKTLESHLGHRKYDMNSLLEGTRFVSEGKINKVVESDIFTRLF